MLLSDIIWFLLPRIQALSILLISFPSSCFHVSQISELSVSTRFCLGCLACDIFAWPMALFRPRYSIPPSSLCLPFEPRQAGVKWATSGWEAVQAEAVQAEDVPKHWFSLCSHILIKVGQVYKRHFISNTLFRVVSYFCVHKSLLGVAVIADTFMLWRFPGLLWAETADPPLSGHWVVTVFLSQ